MGEGEGRREKGEGGEGRREKGEGRREKGEGRCRYNQQWLSRLNAAILPVALELVCNQANILHTQQY